MENSITRKVNENSRYAPDGEDRGEHPEHLKTIVTKGFGTSRTTLGKVECRERDEKTDKITGEMGGIWWREIEGQFLNNLNLHPIWDLNLGF